MRAATTAICNPTVNSYKRLVAAWDAPIYAVWSERSANALVRVPPGQAPPRIEMRSPDPACNPYLALAVLIARGRRRHRARDAARPPLVGFDLRAHRERPARARHHDAAEIAAPSDRRARRRRRRAVRLGDHLYHAFRDAKLEEYERYRRAVHPWERDQYLKLY